MAKKKRRRRQDFRSPTGGGSGPVEVERVHLVEVVRRAEEARSVDSLREVLDAVRVWELEYVDAMRASGCTWAELQGAYGVSTLQGARQRVARLRKRIASA